MWKRTLQMAWRNIWRNRRRTLITSSSIALGLAAMIVYLGLFAGMNKRMLEIVTRSNYGAAQIHAIDYRSTRRLDLVIPDGIALLDRAAALPGVEAVAPRLLATGLLAIGDRSAGVDLFGIDLVRERTITDWHERLVAGHYPESANEVLLGDELADKLELEPGDKVVLTVADAPSGEMRNRLLRLAGTMYTGNPSLDKGSAILGIDTLRGDLGLPDGMHEIVFSLEGLLKDPEPIRAALASLASPSLEILPWQELNSGVYNMIRMQALYLGITVLIIFSIIAIGIVNTLAMSLAERRYEFGVLRALGTTPRSLAALIFTEAASLGIVGTVLGLIAGLLIHWPMAVQGLNLGGFQYAGVTFESRIFCIYQPGGTALIALLFIILTIMVGLGTAIRAGLIRPAEALRHY
ncbi:MAG: ABC transporter permease [bacterium]|nr:ABC transporter permease [bacterium]